MNELYERIYALVRMIPEGRVSTFGAIANAIGSAKGARLVGYALNHSLTIDPPVPAHRVVNRKGLLTGKHHFPTPDTMMELLESEGIEVIDDQVVRFDELFWEPPILE